MAPAPLRRRHPGAPGGAGGPRPGGDRRARRTLPHGRLVHQHVPGGARSGPGRLGRGRGRGAALGDILARVKEQLRAIPDHGIGYGLLRHLNPDTAPSLRGLAEPQIGFNYLGRFDTTAAPEAADWALAPEAGAIGGEDPGMPVAHALEVTAATQDRADGPELSVVWQWPAALLDQAVVEELADAWSRMLQALARHAESPQAVRHTPSDMDLIEVSQDELDDLLAELDD
ncbi:hypothetical protein ACFQ0M_11955 [Kitasatospora aburaviensis]